MTWKRLQNYIKKNNIPYVETHQALFEVTLPWVFKDGLWLEFGVATGKTINYIASCAPSLVYGFDSFEGLPEDFTPAIKEGHFEQEEIPDVLDNVRLEVGLFQDTLEDFLEEHEDLIAYVHLDADIYTSTRYVLDTLAPRIQPGTVMQFDDIFYFDQKWYTDEFDAWHGFVQRFNVEYHWIAYTHQRASLFITSIERL
jgi:hypothetical protein